MEDFVYKKVKIRSGIISSLKKEKCVQMQEGLVQFPYGLSRLESALSFSCEDVWGNPVLCRIPGSCTLAVSLGNCLDLYK